MIREHRTALMGRTVRYLETGTGRPMLFLHAFPLGAEIWRPQLEAVPRGWRFIAPDLRGFGGSTIDRIDLGMDHYASDIVRLMDTLALQQAVIAGLSMGGYIAFALVRNAPERIAGLVLADTKSVNDTDEGRQARKEMLAAVRRGGVAVVAEQMVPKLLGRTSLAERPDVVAAVRRSIESNGTKGIEAAIYALMRRPDSTADLGRIDVPTLVVVGEEDGITPPSDAQSLQRSIRGAALSIMPRAGHLSNLEAPAEFSTTISGWAASSFP
jgi:3-oxoadipate enol-lactonase